MSRAITKQVYVTADNAEFSTEAEALRHEIFTALKESDAEPSGTYAHQHEAIYRAITNHFTLVSKLDPVEADPV